MQQPDPAHRRRFGGKGVLQAVRNVERVIAPEVKGMDAAEQALMLGEFYRKDGGWRFMAVGQGFNGGLGARGTRDGISCLSYPANVASIPVEVIEGDAPILFEAKAFAEDSAGAGRSRGGCGPISTS